MYRSTFKNKWVRRLVIFMAGLALKGGFDVVFMLLLKNYDDWFLHKYVLVALLVVVVGELLRKFDTKLDRVMPWEGGPRRRIAFQLTVSLLLSVSIFGLARVGYMYLFADNFLLVLFHEVIAASYVVVSTFFFVLMDMGLFFMKRWRHSLAELERFRTEKAEFHLEMLRSQVNPHFLFNSLNTLASLVHADPNLAGDFVRSLSSFYRYILDQRKNNTVKLSQELEAIDAYVYIQETRFQHNVRFRVSIDLHLLDKRIAPMTLQMLIENSIKHNVVSRKKNLHIEIYNEGDLYITVRNNLQLKKQKEYSSGIGLENIRSRYAFVTELPVKVEHTDEFFTVSVPLLDAELAEAVDEQDNPTSNPNTLEHENTHH